LRIKWEAAPPEQPAGGQKTVFDDFETRRIKTSGTEIHLRLGGSGSPLLLLHGYPQSHVMWHRIAPRLAERFTVVAADLRGYGDSGKPPGGRDHENYSKRAMALDQVEVLGRARRTRGVCHGD
jgi:haloacetate dehalogenase